MIKDNLNRVKEKIEEALIRRGLKKGVKLLAVTKGFSSDVIEEAYREGQRSFGENYIQEALEKMGALKKHGDIDWHFIGGLQSNKAKKCFDFCMVQTVDRLKLAEELSKQALKRGIKDFPILIEVNLAGEQSKSGISKDKVHNLLEKVSPMKGVKVKGLMTIPPWFEDCEKSRPYFVQLRKLKDEIESNGFERVRMEELSMGMSNDYQIAVEEGATIVRVGSAIFGERKKR